MHLPAGSSLPNTHYRVSVKGIMFNEQGNLFVLEENNDQFDIDLPGGGLDHGEIAIECLSREIQEELGCAVKIGKHPLATRMRKRHNGIWYFFTGYPCKIDLSTFSSSDEASSYKFVSKEWCLTNKEKLPRIAYIIEHYDELVQLYRNSLENL